MNSANAATDPILVACLSRAVDVRIMRGAERVGISRLGGEDVGGAGMRVEGIEMERGWRSGGVLGKRVFIVLLSSE